MSAHRIASVVTLLVACSAASSSTPTGERQADGGTSPTGGDGAQKGAVSQVPAPPCPELDAEACAKACESGTPRACSWAGLAVRDRGREGAKRAVVHYERGCKDGEAESCRLLGNAHQAGLAVAKDDAKATKLFQQALAKFHAACETGRAEDCVLEGFLKEQGWGTPLDEAGGKKLRLKALEIYESACNAGDFASCAEAGDAHAVGFLVKKDIERSRKLLATGCDGGAAHACFLLAIPHAFGTSGITKDEKKAAELLKKSCDDESSKACNALGALTADGRGVTKDLAAALSLFERACEGPGDIRLGVACHDAANVRREKGEGTSARVLELEKKACLHGFKNGCDTLLSVGKAALLGEGQAKDPVAAAKVFKEVCEIGNALACSNYGVMVLAGTGTKRDRDEAIRLFTEACDAGEKQGCDNLAHAKKQKP